MTCPKWSLFVAGLCTFFYTCAVLYMFTGFVGLHDMNEDATPTKGADVADGLVDPDDKSSEEEVEVNFSRDQIASLVVEFVGEIIMLIACVFLVVGIKKNNHKFMAPWIYLSIIDVVFNLGITYFEDSDSDIESFAAFAIMVFIAAMWFPIFSVYKELRRANTQPKSNTAAIESTYESNAYFQHVQQTATAPIQV